MQGPTDPKSDPARNDNKPAPSTSIAIRDALTPKCMAALHGYAKKRCRILRILGVRLASDAFADLVAEAITDTISGHLTWRPSACKLETHICQTVKTRTHKLMKSQRTIQHIYPLNDNAWEDLATDHARPPDEHHIRHEQLANLLDDIETEFAARNDQDVLDILTAWRSGCLTRADAAAHAKLLPSAYDNARARILRWARTDTQLSET